MRDKREVNPSLGVFGFDFAVAHQSAMFHQPTERALDDPPFGQDNKATADFAAQPGLGASQSGNERRCQPFDCREWALSVERAFPRQRGLPGATLR